jgi:PEGA domain
MISSPGGIYLPSKDSASLREAGYARLRTDNRVAVGHVQSRRKCLTVYSVSPDYPAVGRILQETSSAGVRGTRAVLTMSRNVITFLGIFLISAVWASAGSKSDYPLSLKILSAKTETVPVNGENNGVPTDCGIQDFSAYCHESRSQIVRNTMVVQDGSGKSYTISCAVDSRWSNCTLLEVGETFGAQKEKHGFTIWYQNSKGKEVKQSYALVPAADKLAVAPRAQQKVPSATPASNSGAQASSAPASSAAPVSSAPVSSAPVPSGNRETVKCNFTSTPSGAEITLDGRYVGNTPSTVGVSTGTHVVVLFVPGFDRWKRELTVSPESDLNVSATLQKTAQ